MTGHEPDPVATPLTYENVTAVQLDMAKVAREFLTAGVRSQVDAGGRIGRALVSIAASLVLQNESATPTQPARSPYEAMPANADEWSGNVHRVLARVEPLDVRADLAEALNMPLTITPEEPDPGRDWSRVRAEVFKPSGKWMYSVWLDYSTLRGNAGGPRGPHGWHFDGNAMAREALRLATERGTSGVSFTELYEGWRMFIPNPPQGYPHYVVGPTPEGFR